jgi:signal transduction histidine kinase
MNPVDPFEGHLNGSKHVAFSTWWPAERRMEISGEFCERFGVKAEDLKNNAHHGLSHLVFPDDLIRAKAELKPAIISPAVSEFALEARVQDTEGGWRTIFTAGRVVDRDMFGHARRIVCHHVDLTDAQNYQRYKSLINKAPMGVFVTLASSPDMVIYMNDHLAEMLEAIEKEKGPDRHAYRNRPLAAFLDSADISKLLRFAANWPRGDWETVHHLTPSLLTKLGNTVDTHITMSRDQWEGKDAWLFYVLDVSDIHRREFELKKKNDELDAFAYTITHDLRAPLITIRNFLGYLEPDAREHPKKQFREDFQRVNRAAAKLDSLLQGLLELSRIGRTDSERQSISSRSEVERVKETLAGDISEAGIRVEVEKHLPNLHANQTRIYQLFQNLMQNAIRYRDPQEKDPYVRFGLITEQAERIFFVRDNGVGIDAVSREKVFEIFTRLRKTGDGAGIGLSIVRKIVELYGGRIWIVSNQIDDKGVEFRFTLPKALSKS